MWEGGVWQTTVGEYTRKDEMGKGFVRESSVSTNITKIAYKKE